VGACALKDRKTVFLCCSHGGTRKTKGEEKKELAVGVA